MSGPVVRCAIYTRKSSEEGLEQGFNSLHAQREACEAYIKSQVAEGWRALPAAYDDGGYSGGSIERPGIEALLADIAAGKVDVVVVYKVDRLTRSLAHFAKIVDAFDAKGVSFVSVTQAFNTTTSMGRLTLNVLLSFAQFEREVKLDEIRQISGEALWATQYQQRPTPAGGELVQDRWFRRYRTGDRPPEFHTILQSWDTANTIAKWSDYSVCTTWGLIGRTAYLLDVHRHRYIYPDLKRAVVTLAKLHGANRVLIEDHASGTQLIQELREQGIGVEGVKHVHNKQDRMISQTAKIEGGFVYVPEDAPWLAEYLHEMVLFPNGKYDDQVDSTSQALSAFGDWSGSMGIFEVYRQDAEAQVRREEGIWVLRAPPGIGRIYGIEGEEYVPDAEGLFHLPGKQARLHLNSIGWTVLRMP